MKIFVVFGSKSDDPVSSPLAEALRADFEVEHQVISAHRDLEKLQEKMSGWKGDAVVAGAGLAAALPGVVAAMTAKPVFGVPVNSQFGGLDSLASIAQMPPGVPVMTCGPDQTEAIVSFLKQYKKASQSQFSKVNFVARDAALLSHPDLLAEMEKAKTAAAERGIEAGLSSAEAPDALNAILVTQAAHVSAGFCLHIPFYPKAEAQKPENYLPILEWTKKGGLWLGTNNMRNVIASTARLKGAAQQTREKAA
jgi:5-(carboxyamino)imidazole ribonucleotide mutase